MALEQYQTALLVAVVAYVLGMILEKTMPSALSAAQIDMICKVLNVVAIASLGAAGAFYWKK